MRVVVLENYVGLLDFTPVLGANLSVSLKLNSSPSCGVTKIRMLLCNATLYAVLSLLLYNAILS